MNEVPQLPRSEVGAVLGELRHDLSELVFPLGMASAVDGRETRADVLHQLDDYMLPRYASIEAPLLAVIGGSTGAGKSTIINSIVRQHIASASAIRPTTRRPLLIHNPGDTGWFDDDRVLPGLARVSGQDSFDSTVNSESIPGDDINEIGLRAIPSVPEGLALLDSPDIDSVVAENRQLAAQLLAAADLWIFVTTAARYADAIPWALLDEAADRNIVVAVVLNRVPAGVGAEVRSDLSARMAQRGLDLAPLFVISEQEFDSDGFISEADIAPLRGWLEGITHDSAARGAVVRQTLGGAVDALGDSLETVRASYSDQIDGAGALRWDVDQAFDAAMSRFETQIQDGTLLRGEVLARWQDVVGTGEWARRLESGVSRLRDRLTGFFTAKPVETDNVEVAIEEGLHTLLVGETERAIGQTRDAWERFGTSDVLDVRESLRSPEERRDRAGSAVREWQNALLDMIRQEGASKKSTARALAFGVNAIGVALIIVIFASTGGLLGGEVAVAGGTAVVAQRLLEAVFGDDAVRRMARQARDDLAQRAKEFMHEDKQVFIRELAELGVDRSHLHRLEDRMNELRERRLEERR